MDGGDLVCVCKRRIEVREGGVVERERERQRQEAHDGTRRWFVPSLSTQYHKVQCEGWKCIRLPVGPIVTASTQKTNHFWRVLRQCSHTQPHCCTNFLPHCVLPLWVLCVYSMLCWSTVCIEFCVHCQGQALLFATSVMLVFLSFLSCVEFIVLPVKKCRQGLPTPPLSVYISVMPKWSVACTRVLGVSTCTPRCPYQITPLSLIPFQKYPTTFQRNLQLSQSQAADLPFSLRVTVQQLVNIPTSQIKYEVVVYIIEELHFMLFNLYHVENEDYTS